MTEHKSIQLLHTVTNRKSHNNEIQEASSHREKKNKNSTLKISAEGYGRRSQHYVFSSTTTSDIAKRL